MSFEHFVESLENVPPELERNFTLMTDLDKRTDELMTRINECTKEYENTTSRSKRLVLRKESNELFEKLSSFADDKIELAIQTYELIDKNIKRLIDIGTVQTTDDSVGETNVSNIPLIGFDMPLDPNEPKYCICRGVSHGEMVACDNKECPIEWFHYGCVGLYSAPKGKWYCGQCFPQFGRKPKSRSKRQKRY